MNPIEALSRHHDDMVARGEAAPTGFSFENVSFVLELTPSGDVHDVIDIRVRGKPNKQGEAKAFPQRVLVPAARKRSGKRALPNLMWDKSEYALGISTDAVAAEAALADCADADKDDARRVLEAATAWDAKRFEAFRRLVEDSRRARSDDGIDALAAFVAMWSPEHLGELAHAKEIPGAGVAFRLQGECSYIHESPVARYLAASLAFSGDGGRRRCMVTGIEGNVATVHPAIKGVAGGHTAGCAIVTYNQPSATSFGFEQGANAPVTTLTAYKYVTALNGLLADPSRKFRVGDTTVVFWVGGDDADAARDIGDIMSAPLGISPATEEGRVSHALRCLASGSPIEDVDAEARRLPFRILGLAANGPRLGVRLWTDTTVGGMFGALSRHYDDLALLPSPWRRPPSVRDIALTAAPYRTVDGKRVPDYDAVAPQAAGELLRAAVSGLPYPSSFLQSLLGRIRADKAVDGRRVSVIKAILQRKGFEMPVGIDLETSDVPYRLGRLFAAIEQAQRDAIPGIQRGVVEKYVASASTSPGRVFPLLIKSAHQHLAKTRRDNPAGHVRVSKMISEIMAGLPSERAFPQAMSIPEQGRFFVGYYHQRDGVIFAKKAEDTTADETAAGDAARSDSADEANS